MEETTKKEITTKLHEAVAEQAVKENAGITIRIGDAPEIKDPLPIRIDGTIDSPLRWLEKRKDAIDLNQCHVEVNRDDMKIGVFINERDNFKDFVIGSLKVSSEFLKFGINQGVYLTGLEISDLIRMNRACFTDRNKAAELVTIMRNFKAKVTTDIEISDDKRGNTAQVRRQAVEGNQPPSFELHIPIFKGHNKTDFTVEIDIDPETLKATLVSPEAQEFIIDYRDDIMDDVIEKIKELCPEIPIIEV